MYFTINSIQNKIKRHFWNLECLVKGTKASRTSCLDVFVLRLSKSSFVAEIPQIITIIISCNKKEKKILLNEC